MRKTDLSIIVTVRIQMNYCIWVILKQGKSFSNEVKWARKQDEYNHNTLTLHH